ncbi:hypothetical protein LUZ60_008346 [Juncus effusus]|nr:hypothetical protein LUZ60_008346 [Juncus effusus]
MASVSGQSQFRCTQPPSRVVHLRNLPWECTEEELIEFGKPFGKVVQTKCNVGTNKNQAFIEFGDVNQAMAMISYYATATEPAQVRGKTVYLQYSNRGEILNSKTTGDVQSNVLLVTLEGVQSGDVSIDVLHLVFSAFGFVHKISTFEKTAGFQALIQFTDFQTAQAAKEALDGRSIPRYLLEEHVAQCSLKITYSAHNDITVKFQSHRSRDFTNPYLPVAPSAIDSAGQLSQSGKNNEPESNVLLASIENMQYAVSIDALHTVFSAFGMVQKIALFEKSNGLQALIQYPDTQTAIYAKNSLEGHPIYEGGYCILRLTYSRHTDLNVKINNERGRDYTGGNTNAVVSSTSTNGPSILGPSPTSGILPPVAPASTSAAYMQQPGIIPTPPTNGILPPIAPASTSAAYMQQPGIIPTPPTNGILPPGVTDPPPGVAPHHFPGNQFPQYPGNQIPAHLMGQQYPGNGIQQVPPFSQQMGGPYNY